MNQKRGSIQLSMKFLVSIIIAIVMLGAGITLLNKFVSLSQDTQQDLDDRTEKQLASLLDSGQQIAVPFSTQTLKRGTIHVFGVGVLNIFDTTNFRITITLSTARNEEGGSFTPPTDPLSWLTYVDTPTQIAKNQKQITKVFVEIPDNTISGTYIFNVDVERTTQSGFEPYDNVRKITIIVP